MVLLRRLQWYLSSEEMGKTTPTKSPSMVVYEGLAGYVRHLLARQVGWQRFVRGTVQ